MITLFSGNPRSGKTASMVDLLIDLAKDRAVYVHAPPTKRVGVDPFHEHLKVPHVPIDANRWPELVPDGAVLVIDEVQDLWRPRGPSVRPPPAITELETHGHRGIDIFVTSQKPRLIDQSVRDLVGRHVHIRDTGWLGRYSYEWPECSENLAWKTCALKKRFKVPARTFEVYKSANVHTKAPRGKSMMPLITLGLLALTIGLVFTVYRSISSKVNPDAKPEVAEATTPNTPAKATQSAGVTAAALTFPMVTAVPAQDNREPYDGRGLQIEGQWSIRGVLGATFGILIDGERVATASLAQVLRMGYTWTDLGPCAGVLRHGERERLITCAKPAKPESSEPFLRDLPGTEPTPAVVTAAF